MNSRTKSYSNTIFAAMLVAAAVVVVILLIVVMKSAIVVSDDTAFVVERLGRYHRTLDAGLHLLTPLVDRVAFRYSLLAAEGELTDVCITRDNVPFSVTTRFRWQIADPKLAAYASTSAPEFASGLVRSRQKQWIGEQLSKDVRETTRELEQAVLRAAAEPAAATGVKIIAINVERIDRAVVR